MSAGQSKERVLYVGHEAMFRNHPIYFMLYAFMIPFGIGALLMGRWWLKAIGETLTVTTQRTSLRRGIISRDISEVMNVNIRNVQLTQGILQRLLGVGNIGVSSSGQADIEIQAEGIRDPMTVKRLIDSRGSSDSAARVGFDGIAAIVFFVCLLPSSLFVFAASKSSERAPVANAAPVMPIRQVPQQVQADPGIPKPVVEKEVPQIAQEAPIEKPILEEPKRPAEPKPFPTGDAPSRKTDSTIADGKLKLAKGLLEKNKGAAMKRFKEIVEQFEGTDAADEAQRLIEKHGP